MILKCILIYLLFGVLIGWTTQTHHHPIIYQKCINQAEYKTISPESLSKSITVVILIMSMIFWPVWLFYSVKRIFV